MLCPHYGPRWNCAVPPDNRKKVRASAGNQGEGGLGEVYFEFRPVGNYMRVNAIHAATGRETFALGPLNASRSDLQRLALRKLKNIVGSKP